MFAHTLDRIHLVLDVPLGRTRKERTTAAVGVAAVRAFARYRPAGKTNHVGLVVEVKMAGEPFTARVGITAIVHLALQRRAIESVDVGFGMVVRLALELRTTARFFGTAFLHDARLALTNGLWRLGQLNSRVARHRLACGIRRTALNGGARIGHLAVVRGTVGPSVVVVGAAEARSALRVGDAAVTLVADLAPAYGLGRFGRKSRRRTYE